MRVHSIVFVEARAAIAMAGGENARSRHGVLPGLTNEWNAAGASRRPMREWRLSEALLDSAAGAVILFT
jgi:hypothetical protein